MTYNNLRTANLARELEWDTSDNGLDGSFYGNELAGEVGEAVDVMTEFYYSSRPKVELLALLDKIAEELADVAICIDLLALNFGIVGIQHEDNDDGWVSVVPTLFDLVKFTGRACNVTKKLERERLGLVGSRATEKELATELTDALTALHKLARAYHVRLDVAVATKFNKTSDKVGLQTKMVVPE